MPGSRNPEQPPSGPLYAPESDEPPALGTERGPGGPPSPQAGAQSLGGHELRRALAFNAVGPALNERDEWLPLSVRQAVADAVLAAVDTAPADAQPFTVEVWPLARVLADVRCGSQDWSWDEEWADLDARHAETGYLDRLEQQIRTNGITMPVLIGTDGRLWDGHHRLRIAVRLGIGYIPVEVPAVAVLAVPNPELQQLRAQLAHIARLADEHPVHIDTALVHAALDPPPGRLLPGDRRTCCDARIGHLPTCRREQRTYPNAKHRGGNAEECQACDGTNPPYPFICPGPDDQPARDR